MKLNYVKLRSFPSEPIDSSIYIILLSAFLLKVEQRHSEVTRNCTAVSLLIWDNVETMVQYDSRVINTDLMLTTMITILFWFTSAYCHAHDESKM